MLKLNHICKLNEDTMATSYVRQLMKEEKKNMYRVIQIIPCQLIMPKYMATMKPKQTIETIV